MRATWHINSYQIQLDTNVSLVLIITKIFLFAISIEISATWNKITFDTKSLENLYAVFKLKSQINGFKFTIQITVF